MLNGIAKKMFREVDNSPLILFRIAFGFLLFFHCTDFLLSGAVYENFVSPPFTFTYIGFEFLKPLPGNGMYLWFAFMAMLGLLIMTGAWYRFSMIAFSIGWTLIYLMQKSNYNNHYYLVLLLCWIMCFLPAQRSFSIDVKRKAVNESFQCHQWIIWLFMAQAAILYFFAAVNKFTPDWLDGRFIDISFAKMHTRRITGVFYASPWFHYLIIYGGILFDLFIIPLLIWKRTRIYAFIVYCGFHLFNSYTYHIGIFPYLSISLALFFFDPSPLRKFFFRQQPVRNDIADASVSPFLKKMTLSVLGVYLLFQILVPLRSLLYPDHVFWSEEGYRMSWKMMLRSKSGHIFYKVVDPLSGKTWKIRPADRFAVSHANWVAICPDIAWQYAQRIKDEFREKGLPEVRIYAIDSVKLNGRPPRLLIDTNVDLARVKWKPFRHSEWILPFRDE